MQNDRSKFENKQLAYLSNYLFQKEFYNNLTLKQETTTKGILNSDLIGKLDFYMKTALIGVSRGVIGLVWEHPLDSIKTQWQTNGHVVKSVEMINYIYKEKGILGFYRGFIPNLIRQSCKNAYRWPLMLYLPQFFKKFNESIFKNKKINSDSFCKIQTGFTIANLETLFICPLERLKVFFMTHAAIENKHYSFLKHFYVLNKGKMLSQLFKGLEPSVLRSNISWISFLYLDHKTRSFLKRIRKVEELDMWDLIFASIIVGIGNLTLSIFIDIKNFILLNRKM